MNESLNLDLPKVDSQVLENPNNNIFENSKKKNHLIITNMKKMMLN